MTSKNTFNQKRNLNKLAVMIRLFISVILALSALGKIADPDNAVLGILKLMPLPVAIAKFSVFALSAIEIALAVLLWLKVPAVVLAVPVIFFAMLLLSIIAGIDCGCFGTLPVFSQISVNGHFFLLAGMFLGLSYLYLVDMKKNKLTASYKTGGVIAVGLMMMAFFPFPSWGNHSVQLHAYRFVNRDFVQAATANQNVQMIDARNGLQFEFGHIPGAVNIPYNTENLNELSENHVLESKQIVIYCSSSHCNAAEILADKLRSLGLNNIMIYKGGWKDWQDYVK